MYTLFFILLEILFYFLQIGLFLIMGYLVTNLLLILFRIEDNKASTKSAFKYLTIVVVLMLGIGIIAQGKSYASRPVSTYIGYVSNYRDTGLVYEIELSSSKSTAQAINKNIICIPHDEENKFNSLKNEERIVEITTENKYNFNPSKCVGNIISIKIFEKNSNPL